MFDGKSLDGWEGNAKYWRVQDGALTGGSLTETMPHNDFLATTKDFENFIVRMKIKLVGAGGFVNSGFQIRSQRVPNDSEMAGYQCDYGDPSWWGCVYDESRRNKLMAQSDMKVLEPVIKRNDWNEYVIKAEGPRIQTWINGAQGVDYTEADPNIDLSGKMGIQVHGGGKALVQVKDITIEELPASPKRPKFQGAPPPAKVRNLNDGPLSPEEQLKTFSLPPDFEIELVAAEQEGIGKFITTAWDASGRLWTMTALEYPVDANENKAAAEALYASRAKDKVLIYDFESRGAPGQPATYKKQPQVFADGLAIPLGMLPYKDGVLVQHGKEIAHFRDTDHDGKSDRRDIILEGLGIEDSHLFLHGFTRGPGDWIYTAQGAFNHSQIKAKDGSVTKWSYCKLGRFTPDGQKFELVAAGLNNIWGFVIDRDGLMWGQEANDLGFPLTEVAVGDNFPGIGNEKLRPYAPMRPAPVKDWQVGGTGLSGLALQEDFGHWPSPYGAAQPGERMFYLANPITNRIQAAQAIRNSSGGYTFAKMPDFVLTSDPWFRPVHIDFGPDGCLYIVDWYNKIISHNEVPRNHPERDKSRGRIWRVRHKDQPAITSPDVKKWADAEVRAALAPAKAKSLTMRTWRAAWEEAVDRKLIEPNSSDWPRVDLRWELTHKKLTEIAAMVLPPDGSYGVDFVRYMIRVELERRGPEVVAFLDSAEGKSVSGEFVLLASQALEPSKAAQRLAAFLPQMKRPVNDEELLILTQHSDDVAVASALKAQLAKPETLAGLLRLKNRLDALKLAPLLSTGAKALLEQNETLAIQLASAFKLVELEPDLAARASEGSARVAPILKALRELGSSRSDLFLKLLQSPAPEVRDEAILCLTKTPDKLLPLWKDLNVQQRKAAVGGLTSTKSAASDFVAAVRDGRVPKEDLDGPIVEKLQAVMGEEHGELKALLESMAGLFQPVLILNGSNSAFVDANVTLDGPFTVETWIRLDPEIGNQDGILGAPDVLDINFYDGLFRVWVKGKHDVIVAKKRISPEMWTHVCATRDAEGKFRLYLNGELDQAEGKPDTTKYEHLAIGRTNVSQGTSGAFSEYRVWNRCRTAEEIRANFDRILDKADGLTLRLSGENWGRLSPPAKIAKTTDFPTLVTPEAAKALDEKFAKFRALAEKNGDLAKGKAIAAMCTACHQVGGQGGQIGPNLSGVGAMGMEAILRNVLTPNAAMEAGYRVCQIQLKDGSVKEGFMAQQDEAAIILRTPGSEDQRIPHRDIRRTKFLKRSMMPEGLIDALPAEMVTDLFSYLKTLK